MQYEPSTVMLKHSSLYQNKSEGRESSLKFEKYFTSRNGLTAILIFYTTLCNLRDFY